MSTTEVLDAALALSASQRSRLIAALIRSPEGDDQTPPFKNASQRELLRRLDDLDERKGSRRTSAQVVRAARARLAR